MNCKKIIFLSYSFMQKNKSRLIWITNTNLLLLSNISRVIFATLYVIEFTKLFSRKKKKKKK